MEFRRIYDAMDAADKFGRRKRGLREHGCIYIPLNDWMR